MEEFPLTSSPVGLLLIRLAEKVKFRASLLSLSEYILYYRMRLKKNKISGKNCLITKTHRNCINCLFSAN